MKSYWLGVPVLAIALAACGGGTSPPVPDVMIPATTKVADTATRTALSAFDPKTGTMLFSSSTPVLQTLAINDVLSGDRSPAAPDGFLRRVVAIRQENGQTVLDTTPATLPEAISKGAVSVSGALTPATLVKTQALRPGVRTQAGSFNGFDFEQQVDVVYRPEAPGTGEVHITGTIDYSLGYHIGIDIGSCFEIPPVCLNHFDASVGFEHKANLNVTGHLETPVKKDIDLASQDFWTQIEIGPVPIPVDFKATLSVGVDGQVSVQFSYAASENVALKVGEEYNDGRGWSPIAERTFAVLPGTPQVTGTAKLQTTTDLEVQVLLIGAVGPGLKGSAGLDFDAQIPRNPIWMLSGLASLDVTFVVDVPVLGKLVDYSANILKWEQELARSGNTPPVIRILNGSVNIELGRTLDLGSSDFSSIYRVSDAEDGHVTDVRLSSDRDGPLPNSTYTFPNAGARTVTVTATDSQGASSTATFTVTVTNTPPVVTLTTSGELPVYRGVPFQLGGIATELNPSTGQLTLPVPCERLTWTSSVPSDILPAGCSGNATFGSNGPRTLTLTATGTNGAKGSAHTDISVTDPPANLSPVIDELHIRDALGNEIGDSQVVSTSQALSLSVRAHDPENDPIHYQWSACLKGWTVVQCSLQGTLATTADGSASFLGVGTYTFFITADDGKHASATIQSRTITINPAVH